MSASEKLKALERGWDQATDRGDDEEWASARLRNALPQIVAVVEAAERVAYDHETTAIQDIPSEILVNQRQQSRRALAALEEALS